MRLLLYVGQPNKRIFQVFQMSTWSRSSYSAAAAAAAPHTEDGWQTVGGGRRFPSQQQEPSASRWDSGASRNNTSFGRSTYGSDIPSAFSKKPRDGDRPPRRVTDEEARRDYIMKLAAEKAKADAEQAKQIADTPDNFPSLGGPKRVAAAAAPPPAKKSWSTHIKIANNENEQKRLTDEKAAKEAAEKLAEGMTVLRLNRTEMREPFFTTGEIETEADFQRNEKLRSSIWNDHSYQAGTAASEAIRRQCFSRFSIMEEQEKYDYNKESGYGDDSFGDDEAPPRAYSPHSPKYPHSFDEAEEAEE